MLFSASVTACFSTTQFSIVSPLTRAQAVVHVNLRFIKWLGNPSDAMQSHFKGVLYSMLRPDLVGFTVALCTRRKNMV